MRRPGSTLTSTYYPPRAGWRANFSRPTRAWANKLQSLVRRLPAPSSVALDLLCILVPGLSFYLAGWRKVGQCILAGWLIAFVVFLTCLGLPIANWAFMFLISAHATSISQRFQPWLAQHRLLTQIAIGMMLFAVVSLLVYMPARTWFEQHIATPLPMANGVLLLNPRTRPTSIQRGVWLAYRITGSYAGGVQVRDGLGFGPVLAVPGDRVTFGETAFRVNGTVRARLAHMPRTGELVIPPKQWLVWPEVGVSMYGVSEDSSAQAMLKIALAPQEDVVGKPFKRWFFRKQTAP
jgi:hypothetical protein